MSLPVEILLSRLDKVRGKYPKYMARCPAHADNGPSLSIKSLEDGTVLVHCFAGCGASDVMAAVGLSLSDLFADKAGEGKPRFKDRSEDPDIKLDELEYLRRENAKLKARARA